MRTVWQAPGMALLVLAACSGPPSPALPAATSSHPSASASTSATAPPPEPAKGPSSEELAIRTARAYEKRQKGDPAGAAADFEMIANALAAAGHPLSPGLGDLASSAIVVRGRYRAGLTPSSARRPRTWFFDRDSGEPIALAYDLALVRGAPMLDGGHFLSRGIGATLGLFDPHKGIFIDLPGPLVAVHPDGHRAYVLVKCRIVEQRIPPGVGSRTLAAHARAASPGDPACEDHGFRDAAVTADGRWLTTRWGRWDLGSGLYKPLPFRVGQGDFMPAVSPDGRLVARVMANPSAPPNDLSQATILRLYDLDSGAPKAASRHLGPLSNGDPLTFGASPPRVCVFDHGIEAFTVPDLAPIGADHPAVKKDAPPGRFGPTSCEDRFVSPPPDHPDLIARLAARVCSADGLLIPRDHCPPSAR